MVRMRQCTMHPPDTELQLDYMRYIHGIEYRNPHCQRTQFHLVDIRFHRIQTMSLQQSALIVMKQFA